MYRAIVVLLVGQGMGVVEEVWAHAERRKSGSLEVWSFMPTLLARGSRAEIQKAALVFY